MDTYEVYLKRSVEKDLASIPTKDLLRILARVRSLATNPRPSRCEKLEGQDRYRIRQGRYRIVYSIQDAELTVCIAKGSQRKDAYRQW